MSARERTELEWAYKPLDFFEIAYETSRGIATLRVANGAAVVTNAWPAAGGR